jgi:hypothetical protein
MINFGMRVVICIALFGMQALAPRIAPSFATPASASSAGDACRKEICDAAVAACMRADLSLNPLARSEVEKKAYCAQFFPGFGPSPRTWLGTRPRRLLGS